MTALNFTAGPAPLRYSNAADELERARSALNALDPSCDHSTWVRIGMAARAAGLDFDDFNRWSSDGSNYAGEHDTRSAWRSFDPHGAI